MNSLLNETHRPGAPLDPKCVDGLPHLSERRSTSKDSDISRIFNSDESIDHIVNFKAVHSRHKIDCTCLGPQQDMNQIFGRSDERFKTYQRNTQTTDRRRFSWRCRSIFTMLLTCCRSGSSPPSPSNDGSADHCECDRSRATKDAAICGMSSRSDKSNERIINFKAARSPLESRATQDSAISGMSSRSDKSNEHIINFKAAPSPLESRATQDSAISGMSFKSDESNERIINFKAGPSPLEEDFTSPEVDEDEEK